MIITRRAALNFPTHPRPMHGCGPPSVLHLRSAVHPRPTALTLPVPSHGSAVATPTTASACRRARARYSSSCSSASSASPSSSSPSFAQATSSTKSPSTSHQATSSTKSPSTSHRLISRVDRSTRLHDLSSAREIEREARTVVRWEVAFDHRFWRRRLVSVSGIDRRPAVSRDDGGGVATLDESIQCQTDGSARFDWKYTRAEFTVHTSEQRSARTKAHKKCSTCFSNS